MRKYVLSSPQWVVTRIVNPATLDVWFSDDKAVLDVKRGGTSTSYRLIAQTQGFLDITELELPVAASDLAGSDPITVLDFNDRRMLWSVTNRILHITLTLPGDGTFAATVTLPGSSDYWSVSGSFKPFPVVSAADAAYIDNMIAQKYVPYPNVPEEPGKTDSEIRELGRRFFPWSPHSYELAMCVYDWTTASFMRMVLFKIFQYTSVPHAPPPSPLDLSSISRMIWESNWDSYQPQNTAYMHSFMMHPASSQRDVDTQLARVFPELYRFSEVQNRLLSAAVHALPRTCTVARPYLFSGQVDIRQMGMSRFGAELREFPGNAGPVGRPLEIEFAAAVASFLKPGSVVTTKACWSFTDREADARHYSNGILLVAEPPDPDDSASLVWDAPGYVTELSNGAEKIEWVFPPGSRFRVLSVEQDGGIQAIRLRVVPPTARAQVADAEKAPSADSHAEKNTDWQDALRTALVAEKTMLGAEASRAVVHAVRATIPILARVPRGEPPKVDHVRANTTYGRRCRCVEKQQGCAWYSKLYTYVISVWRSLVLMQ
ncbi:hypothetical protein C8Q80DRAFT_309288 [Daedaleopsis nitida]|nr:hypothetical protein C8Q80DRAFT_309288 [Daedaleopsis nitida]